MIRIDKQEVFPEVPDVVVWGDDKVPHLFYVLPSSPRFRLQDGKPVFKFIKYRLPVEREDGRKGGGFIFFDTEIAVPDAKMQKVTELLQERINKRHAALNRPGSPPKVQFGTITYTRGSVRMLLEENGVLIEKVRSAGKPSLYGNNVAVFAVELTPEGATVLEAAMQGQGASAVSIVYDLYFWVKLPPIRAVVTFNSEKFYEYSKTVDIEVSGWDEDHYREEVREVLRQSEAGKAEIHAEFTLPDPEADRKLKDRLRDWSQRMLEDSLTRMTQQAAAQQNGAGQLDTSKLFDKTLEELGSDDLDSFQQVIQQRQLVDFHYELRENSAAEWNLAPQGTLPTLTSLQDEDGRPIKWEDYSLLIDANDPFFQQLNLSMQVNADFDTLPLHSVELQVEYAKSGGRKEIAEFRFANTDEVHRFTTFIENNSYDYTYFYEVNYRGQSRTFRSAPIKSDERMLTVNLDDTGIFNLEILTGDIDFEQVRIAQVDIRYPAGAAMPIAQQKFTIDQNNQAHRMQKVIFDAIDKPYEYRVKYVMADGKEIETGPIQEVSKPLILNDPFSEVRSVTVRASGDLQGKVQSIFLDLVYLDEKNNYRQSRSIALDANTPGEEWLIPVIAGAPGVVTYSGLIRYFDGTEEPIPESRAERPTILVGPSIRDILQITVLPDFMFDNPDVRLVRVALKYTDDENGINERKDFTFRPGEASPSEWVVELKNKDRTEYTWEATFFTNNGQQKVSATTSDLTVIPALPA